MQASQLEDADLAAAAQAAPVRSTGATVAAADSFHAVRPPGFEIKARLAGIQVICRRLCTQIYRHTWDPHIKVLLQPVTARMRTSLELRAALLNNAITPC